MNNNKKLKLKIKTLMTVFRAHLVNLSSQDHQLIAFAKSVLPYKIVSQIQGIGPAYFWRFSAYGFFDFSKF